MIPHSHSPLSSLASPGNNLHIFSHRIRSQPNPQFLIWRIWDRETIPHSHSPLASPGNNLYIFSHCIRSPILNPLSLIHIRSQAENVFHVFFVLLQTLFLLFWLSSNVVWRKWSEKESQMGGTLKIGSPHLQGQLPPWTLWGHLPSSYPSQTPLHSHSF